MTPSTIQSLYKNIQETLAKSEDLENLEIEYKKHLGKKSEFSSFNLKLKNLSIEERRKIGSLLNEKRKALEAFYKSKKQKLHNLVLEEKLAQEEYDPLRPLPVTQGHLHPITQIQNFVEDFFTSLGFEIMDGPEVESDEFNFKRLNFLEDHPARDMQDTIWTQDANLLRTHTSAVQVRSMLKLEPPFRIIAPGRCFRYEEMDASHENTFHQVEGMLIGKDISIAHLISIMKNFLTAVFEKECKVRLRPGYFPFVEPGFELDMACLICNGKGCPTCKYSSWIEILPCGLVHPNVLEVGGIDFKVWSGFAFGLGLDRLAMMRYGIEDIRHFLSGNLRFLEQF